MLARYLIFICLNGLFLFPLNAQEGDLNIYRWENRLLLMLCDDANSKQCDDQLALLEGLNPELEERKLLLFQVEPDRFRILDNQELIKSSKGWISDKTLFRKYHIAEQDFTVLLIGLDGGVKLKQSNLLTRQELFDRIDSMPMRRAELKSKN